MAKKVLGAYKGKGGQGRRKKGNVETESAVENTDTIEESKGDVTPDKTTTETLESTPDEVEAQPAEPEVTEKVTDESENEDASTPSKEVEDEVVPVAETESDTSTNTPTEPEQDKKKDNRKQIKLSPYLMEKIELIKKMRGKGPYYEVLDELVDFYVQENLTSSERDFFNMNMDFLKNKAK